MLPYVIEGSEFETLDELKDAVLGYNFYYNEVRHHQGIGRKRPTQMMETTSNEQFFKRKKRKKKTV